MTKVAKVGPSPRASGSTGGLSETFEQLDELLVTLGFCGLSR